eukprot:Phypoly_transcript_08690.p1 GENE.Phypoly_transcript_08690~~Phypoly_transcript_08690.p1  ORF type:complete len:409 (+),score=66.80 Phypoly_transcript_08690:122-1348(+)
MASLLTLPPPPTAVPDWQGILFGTISAPMAVVFTNPFDTTKVRLQLQGQNKELPMVYKNSFDCFYKIFKSEGIRGLQQGLSPALYREASKNVFRIGAFEPIMNRLHDKKKEKGSPPLWKRIVAGAASGALGALSCNPFELIKTRMQAQTLGKTTAVGYQHNYTGLWSAMASIYKKDGVAGLYVGSMVSVFRGTIGTSANLATYSYLRDYIITNKVIKDGPINDMLCSFISSFVCCAVMNPLDVTRTRVYNQPRSSTGEGLAYKNAADAFGKIVRNEGVFALYKGLLPSFFRLGPHFTLTFLFYEQMKRISLNQANKKYLQENDSKLEKILAVYDKDGDGKLNLPDLVGILEQQIPRSIFASEEEYERTLHQEARKIIEQSSASKDAIVKNEIPQLWEDIEDVVHKYKP